MLILSKSSQLVKLMSFLICIVSKRYKQLNQKYCIHLWTNLGFDHLYGKFCGFHCSTLIYYRMTTRLCLIHLQRSRSIS